MKWTGIICAGLLWVVAIVHAEQPKAQQYKDIFNSGKFYVEFADSKQNYVVASLTNMRLATIASQYYNSDLDYYNGKKDYPNELYMNGKYYQFRNKKTAIVARENQLQDENVDPRGKWNYIKNRLSVPIEFYPICVNDAFRDESKVMVSPEFRSSETIKLDGKEFNIDRYVIPMHSHTGAVLSETEYQYFYEKENLVRIDMSLLHEGQVSKISSIKIKQITDVIPDKIFMMPKGCKVYEVGTGDMNDLLEQLPVVESY